MTEDFLTLYCDPGEDFGWAVGNGTKLLAAGTEKMWLFADLVWEKFVSPEGHDINMDDPEQNPLAGDTHIRADIDPAEMLLPIGRIVCEDFRIYPWAAADLAFDQVRTARVIGALTWFAHHFQVPLVLQGANIKAAAVAAGAEELYYKPLRENRHQNDAIQHFVFFTNVELLGLPLPVPEGTGPEAYG